MFMFIIADINTNAVINMSKKEKHMAFDPNNKSIKKALQQTEIKKTTNTSTKDIVIPIQDGGGHETTKSFNFTLKPSVRDRLRKLAKAHNYKSDSKFLSDLIENIKE